MKYVLLCLLLAACVTPATETRWMKPGASAADFYADRGQCQAQGFSVPGANTMQFVLVFASCMQGKGWYQETRQVGP